MEIREKIAECISLVLRVDLESVSNLPGDQILSSVGMDSLNCIDLVVSIEEEFGISFTDEELLLQNLNTINKLSQIVEQKLSENA